MGIEGIENLTGGDTASDSPDETQVLISNGESFVSDLGNSNTFMCDPDESAGLSEEDPEAA